MNIWIMRHGEAGFNAPSDQLRTLTAHGEKMAFLQGEWLMKRFINQQISLDKIITSPYQRTQQTLQCVLAGMQAVNNMQSFAKLSETWNGITPSSDVETVGNYLRFLRDEGAKNVLIISHLPLVYDLVSYLTQAQSHVHFYPAVIAEIHWQGEQGKLITTSAPA